MTIRTERLAQASAPRTVQRKSSKSSSGPVGDAAGDDGPAGSSGGNQRAPSRRFAAGEEPVVDEGFLQVGDDGAFEAEMEVLNGAARAVLNEVALADVHAAGKPDAAVDDEDLAVVAEVDGHEPPGDQRRQKADHGHSVTPEEMDDRRKGITRARGIDQDTDVHAPSDGPTERLGQAPSDGVIVEDVAGEGDRFGGLLDRFDHGRQCFVAVHQRHDPVAGHEWFGDQFPDQLGQPAQFGALGQQFVQHGGTLPGGSAPLSDAPVRRAPQENGPAPDPVDTEDEVKQTSDERDEPDDADPEEGSARIALVKNGVDGGDGRHDERDGRRYVVPESGEPAKHVHLGEKVTRDGGECNTFCEFRRSGVGGLHRTIHRNTANVD